MATQYHTVVEYVGQRLIVKEGHMHIPSITVYMCLEEGSVGQVKREELHLSQYFIFHFGVPLLPFSRFMR